MGVVCPPASPRARHGSVRCWLSLIAPGLALARKRTQPTCAVLALLLSGAAQGATFVVNSTGDSADTNIGNGLCDTGGTNSQGATECTLRAAIQEANASAPVDAIHFNIPTTEPGYGAIPLRYTIGPASALPAVTAPVTLDGATQPDFPGTPIIEIDGIGAGGTVDGLSISAGGSSVRGLVINRFTRHGIAVTGSDGNTLAGNYIGLDVAGVLDRGNGGDGVVVASANNTIGGSIVSDRNVISGNDSSGIRFMTAIANNNDVFGNYIGTNAAGTGAVANTSHGVNIVSSPNNTIGGPGANEGNLISGNGAEGISLNDPSSSGNVIQSNQIGTDHTGTTPVPNAGLAGIRFWLGADVNLIGGTLPAEGNLIARNSGDGIVLDASAGADNSIIGNLIYLNGGEGIDLGANGVSANDGGDGDSGPNDLLNYPEIASAIESSGNVNVDFDLDVPAGGYRIEFFKNPSGADPSGNGEGESYASSVNINHPGGGSQSFSHAFSGSAGDVITATATECTDAFICAAFGSTSEFGASVTATLALNVVVVNSTGDAADDNPGDDLCDTAGNNSQGATECTLRAAIQEANASALVDTIHFNMPATEAGYVAGPNYWSIGPGSQLPPVSTTMTIDGSTQATWVSVPVVEVEGSSAGAFADGLRITGDNSTVRSLAINRFQADGIEVATGASGTTIAGNHIGLDPTGLIDRGNARGIDLASGSGPTTVGGALPADRNVISGNGGDGIIVWDSDSNIIIGNYIGTDLTGNAPLANDADGIALGNGSSGNTIGQAGAGNVLSGNVNDGVELDGNLTGNVIQGNTIGLGADGDTIVPNGRHGMVLYDGVATTQIGGTGAGEGNVVSANTEQGIHINGNSNAATANNIIEGNFVGTDATGTVARGNGTRGIFVTGGANNTTIGGTAAGARNVISGNGEEGVHFQGAGTANNSVLGNFIGTDVGGTIDVGNTLSGVRFNNFSANNTLGGTLAAARNVISGNNYAGVRFSGASAGGNLVLGNYVGTDLNGTGSLGSSFGVIFDNDAAGNRVGGTTAAEANVIANHAVGVRFAGGATIVNPVLGNRIYSNTGLGIDLNPIGVNSNDIGDGDTGANGLLNYPEFTAAIVSGGNVTVDFDLDVPAGSYRIEFFTNPSGADPSGNGEGESFADSVNVTHPGGGSQSFSHVFPGAVGDVISSTATNCTDGATCAAFGGTSEFSGTVTVASNSADLTLTKTDSPDPAPAGGPLLYTLLVSNGGPGSATNVSLTDTLPASVTLVSATPSQGSCVGVAVVTCSLGSILNGGTATVEILVTTGGAGSITNNASVTADQADPVPADNAVSEDTTIVVGGTTDIPLTQFARMHGFLDSTVTGGSLRAQPNGVDPCALNGSSSANLAGVPGTASIRAAYLYWAGSGTAIDSNVTLDATGLVADRTWTSRFVLGPNNYDFFAGFKDVTAQVDAKRNGLYTFGGLTVDNAGIYCGTSAVIAGWSMIVVYEDSGLSGKTLVLYDGFDIARNGSTSYLLSGIYASGPTEAKTSTLLWEGDDTLGGANEQLLFNATPQTDGLNPANNVYNSTINSIGDSTAWGVDHDTFDVSALVSVGDTLASTQVDTGPDLVILNSVLLQVKSNVIVGTVFEDVNYGGGPGRDLAAARAAAPAFAVERPGVTVELYDAGGTLIRTSITDASGGYGFAGLPDGNYNVRVVSDTVTSSRPGSTGAELPVQTFRTDASGAGLASVLNEVGGADPSAQDDPANGGGSNLAAVTAQSLAPVTITAATAKTDVDFGFNFDTVVNTNDAGQGSLRQFLLNSNLLTNANLDQAGLTTGVETSLFMIPSDTDPLGRPQDPNFDAGRGVATINVGSSRLPVISDDATAIDGTTQTTNVGDTNAGTAGNPELAGVSVGTGPDGIEGTGDEPSLPTYVRPEVELDGNDQGFILEIAASGTLVEGLSLFNTSLNDEGIHVAAGTGNAITGNFLGPNADGADPGAALRLGEAVEIIGVADFTNNFVGYTSGSAIFVRNTSIVSGNEIYQVSQSWAEGDGISVQGSSGQAITIRENRTDRAAGYGVESWDAPGPFVIENNTLSRSGQGGGVEDGGIRLFGAGSTVRSNVVTGNAGAGIVLAQRSAPGSNAQNLVSQNAIYANGGPAIDLDVTNTGAGNPNGDGVTANDGNTDGNLPNRDLDYPVIAEARLAGASLRVQGYVGTASLYVSGPHTIEVFKADDDGNNNGEIVAGDTLSVAHGEARWYLDNCVSAADGSFDCTLTVPPSVTLNVGDAVAATATDGTNNTSEVGANAPVAPALAIVKRAFMPDGTPIPSGATIPNGMLFRYLLFIDNPDAARNDVSLQDVLDPAFAYQAGTMRVDNSLASCAAALCTPAEEAAIFAAASAAATMTDAVDGDVVSYTGGSTTIDAGNQSVANAQLDLAGAAVWAMVFDVRMQ